MRTPGRPRTLRARLVATVLVLLAVTFAVIGVTTTLALRQYLFSRLDREVAEASTRFVYARTGQLRLPPGVVLPPGVTLPPGVPQQPGTQQPGTQQPGTQQPGTQQPGTQQPGTQQPGTQQPGTQQPGTQQPGTQQPNAQKPGTSPTGTPQRDFFLGPVQGPRTLGATVRDGVVQRAEVSSRGGGASAVPAQDAAVLAALAPAAQPRTVDLSLGAYRVLATQVGDVTYVIGQPAGEAQDVVDSLIVTELIVIGLALVGAVVAGAVLVRRELRPLERVADTAATVSALPLDRGEVELVERVRDVDPRTEVGQVATALNQMLDNVGGALEARQDSEMRLRQFIADASHELRTPLAAIRGYAELSRRAALSPETEYSILRISSQADRMTTLVEDLLLLARLDAGRPLERGTVDLTRLVIDGVDDAHAAGRDHRWQLDLPDEPVVVPGDASRLTQVLGNLLANARTHTPAGTTVVVGLAPQDAGVALRVTDDGPGIPPDLLPHVFERFARGSVSRSRETGSTGLGLAIVDAVVAAHGGRVQVESRPGRTTFRVWLPTAQARTGTVPALPAPAAR